MKLNLLWIFAVILLCATKAECNDMNGRTKAYESISLQIFIFAVVAENDEESKIMIWLRPFRGHLQICSQFNKGMKIDFFVADRCIQSIIFRAQRQTI